MGGAASCQGGQNRVASPDYPRSAKMSSLAITPDTRQRSLQKTGTPPSNVRADVVRLAEFPGEEIEDNFYTLDIESKTSVEKVDSTGKIVGSHFHNALAQASEQLRMRQCDGNTAISKEEMEDLVLLAREMENLKQIMKRSQFTVEGTWAILEKEGMLERFGQQLYDDMLSKSPRLRVFFYGVDLDEQARTLVRMLGTAVHYYQKPQVTVDMFTKAGARHRGYGITDDVFKEMEVTFFKVFPKFVGQDVFDAATEEWQKFWKLVLELLKHGSHSTEGDRYGSVYEVQQMKKLQADFRLIAERQNKCVQRQQFVAIMYAKAIEMSEELSKFEALKDLRASNHVFQSFINITNNALARDRVEEYLLELGARHVSYGVTKENVTSFIDPFLFACRHFLQEEWNVTMEARFLWFFKQLVDGIGAGMARKSVGEAMPVRPSGGSATFCLLYTDIEAGSKLRQLHPEAMEAAVERHNELIRGLIAEHGAYEVKRAGDAFIIAAKDVFTGAKIALSIQLELMRMAPIANGFKMIDTTEGRGDAAAWDNSTLRVRISMEHCTDAVVTYDTINRRYDYYGPSVNRCARIEAATCGGQIMMSRQTFEALRAIPEFHDEPCPPELRDLRNTPSSCHQDSRGLDHFVSVSDVGHVSLKGIAQPVHLVSLVPKCLSGRLFIEKIPRVSSNNSP